MKTYTNRPKLRDASQKAWDLAIKTHGKIQKMLFIPSCKEGCRWVVLVDEEKRMIIYPKDLENQP